MTSTTGEATSMCEAGDNPHPQKRPPHTFATRGDKMVVVMVGLPARGKSYISGRVTKYLSFFYGVPCRTFNVGNYRRKLAGSFQPANFFDPANHDAAAVRRRATEMAMEDLVAWMNEVAPNRVDRGEHRFVSGDFGALGIFDATNSTGERRSWIVSRLAPLGVKIIFLEAVCNIERLIEQNIMASKVGAQDYANVGVAEAVADFRQRIEQYRKVYQTMQLEVDADASWIKLIDAGRAVEINNVRGFLPSRIVQFTMNLHTTRRSIYLTRHGQSEYNVSGKIGGDSSLSELGEAYAVRLAEWVQKELCLDAQGRPQLARLWTSSLKRAVDTARHIPHPPVVVDGIEYVQMRPKVFNNLDEIFAGVCDGMSPEELARNYPHDMESRAANKFEYRYPRGESYVDLIARLEPLAHEIERQREPLLIVAHQAILRCLYAYLMGLNREECVRVSIPLNTVFKLTPTSSGCKVEHFSLLEVPPELRKEPSSH